MFFEGVTARITGIYWQDGLVAIGFALLGLLIGVIGWSSGRDLVRWRKPALILHEGGLAFPASRPEWLPWDEIKSVDYYDVSIFPKFAIDLKHPERHIPKWRRHIVERFGIRALQ